MHLLLRRADRDGHRRRDGHGSRLRERRLPGHHRERRERHRRGSHRRRHHPDVRPVRRRDDRGVLLRVPDEPNGSASHPDWGEEASSPGSDEVRPGPERDEAHPDREPDDCRPTVRRDEAHPVRARAVRHRGAGHREQAEEPVVPRGPRSTGCCRHAELWGPAWGRDLRAWVLPEPVLRRRCRPTRREPARPEQRAARRARPVPEQRAQPGVFRRVPVLPGLRVLPALPGGVPAWGLDGVHPALLCPASRCCRRRDRLLRDRWVQMPRVPTRPSSRTGRTHEVDEPPGPRLWMMRT